MKIKKTITMSEIGLDNKLGLEQLFCFMQDVITVMFGEIRLSNWDMRNKHHGIWVFTKNKVTVTDRPEWNEEVSVDCRIVKVTPLLVYVKTEVFDKYKRVYFTGITECCAIDYETFRFIKTELIKIPHKEEEVDTSYDFQNSDMEKVSSLKVCMPLVDTSHHLNNAKAVLPVAMALSKAETLAVYAKPFELGIKYSKQAMIESEICLFLHKDFDRINFAYKNSEDQVLELGYIKTL